MRIKIDCTTGPQFKFDSVDCPGTPFAITRLQESVYWRVTHKPSGYAARPWAWSVQEQAVKAVYDAWNSWPEAIQVLFTHGTLEQIVNFGGRFAMQLDRTADCKITYE